MKPGTCLRCGTRSLRPAAALAVELRDFLKAMPHVALIEYPEPSIARGDPALLEHYWAAATEALGQEFARGLAEELQGKCVYCAHVMDPQRRWAMPLASSRLSRGQP